MRLRTASAAYRSDYPSANCKMRTWLWESKTRQLVNHSYDTYSILDRDQSKGNKPEFVRYPPQAPIVYMKRFEHLRFMRVFQFVREFLPLVAIDDHSSFECQLRSPIMVS